VWSAKDEFITLVNLVFGRDIKQWHYPPSVVFVKAALKLNLAFIDGIFGVKRSLAQLGVGKSVYALKTLYNVYDKKWDVAKRYVVFMPQHFLSLFEDAIDKNYRIPAVLWDDASFWIGKLRWQSELVKAVKEFLGVIRTHCAYLVFTAPKYSDIARGIREDLNFGAVVRFAVYTSDVRQAKSVASYYTFEDLELLYHRSKNPAPFAVHFFKLYFEHYPDYEQIRKDYVRIGKERMKERLKEIAERAKEEMVEIMKKYDARKRPEPLIDPEEIEAEEEEVDGIEELGEGGHHE